MESFRVLKLWGNKSCDVFPIYVVQSTHIYTCHTDVCTTQSFSLLFTSWNCATHMISAAVISFTSWSTSHILHCGPRTVAVRWNVLSLISSCLRQRSQWSVMPLMSSREVDGVIPHNVWLPSQQCIEFTFSYTAMLQVLDMWSAPGKLRVFMHVRLMHYTLSVCYMFSF